MNIAVRATTALMKMIRIHCMSSSFFLTVGIPIFFLNLFVVCSPLVMKVRSRSGSVMSGASTPGGGAFKSLSEGDLKKADAALSQVNGYHQ